MKTIYIVLSAGRFLGVFDDVVSAKARARLHAETTGQTASVSHSMAPDVACRVLAAHVMSLTDYSQRRDQEELQLEFNEASIALAKLLRGMSVAEWRGEYPQECSICRRTHGREVTHVRE